MNMTSRKIRYNDYDEGFAISYSITKIWRMRLLVRTMKRTHRDRLNVTRTIAIRPRFIPIAEGTKYIRFGNVQTLEVNL